MSDSESDGRGSKAWATRTRKRAKELARLIDVGYVDLCTILWEVWDTPVEGDRKMGPVYKSWGFKTFPEYAEVELGIQRRKAEYLRNIGCKLDTDLRDLDPKLKESLIALGWSKLRQLTPVLTLRNAADWIDNAQRLNHPELMALVTKHRERKMERMEKRAQAAAVGAGGVDAEVVGADAEEEDDGIPAPERLKLVHFMLFEPQATNLEQALVRAQEMSHSEKRGHNLDLICMDFLASNSFGTANDPAMIGRWLAKIESVLGIRLVAVGPTVDSGLIYSGPKALDVLGEVFEAASKVEEVSKT